MAVTLRNDAKEEIINILREEGYATFARLADFFDIYLTDNPEVIGYMIPGKAAIVLNQDLSISQVSLLVRHEILHEFFTHAERQAEVDDANKGKYASDHELANIAGDFNISQWYTDRDKSNTRAIRLGNKTLRGLLVEDERPEWLNMTFEEMYNELLKEKEQDYQALKSLLDQLDSISKRELEDLIDQIIDQQMQGQDGDPSDDNNGEGQEGDSKNSSDQSGSAGKNQRGGSSGDLLSKLEDEARKIQQDVQDLEDKTNNDNQVFDSDKDKKAESDLAKRIIEIKRIFKDLKEKDAILDNSRQIQKAEKAAKAASDIQKVQTSPLNRFKLSLNSFISDQIEEEESETYARENPSYEDSDFFFPGKMIREEKHIPSINVYWDVSGSFPEGSAKTKAAERAIATLNHYVNNGDITITPYYFADRVSETRSGAGGGTQGTPILEHVKQTKPTNVIVVTDSDISDCREYVKVPGAVWYLFFEGSSENIATHLTGKKQTRSYLVINY